MKTWRIPKGWGRVLGGTLLVLFGLAQLLPDYASNMYYVFGGIFNQVFALQGIAAVMWTLEEHGRGRILKVFVFIVGYFVFQLPAVVFGIADQSFDFSHRREKLGSDEAYNPFDPRADHK